jgi:chitodextrinase
MNEIYQGDNGTVLNLTITNDESVIDLTGSIVEVVIKYKRTGIKKTATIIDAQNGKCQVTLNAEDVNYEGVYSLQATVKYSNGNTFTSNVQRFIVNKKIGYVPVIGGTTGDVGDSSINGNIIINGIEIKVYDDTQIKADINNLLNSQHTHTNKSALDRLGVNAQNKLTIDGVELVSGGIGGSSVSDSLTNGNILVNGNEVQVYDDTSVKNLINGKQASGDYATRTELSNGLSQKADTTQLHSHTNKSTLDKLTDDGINLLFNGLALGNGGAGSTVSDSTTNGNILVNGQELNVYNDGELRQITAILSRLGINENGKLTIDGVEQTGGEEMTLVVKDYFEGSANITKTYTDSMVGFEIANDAASGGSQLTFTINNLTIPVKAQEVYSANFDPYKSVTITTTVPYRATVSSVLNGTITQTPADTVAPNDVTGLTTSNVTYSGLTLTWTTSSSTDTTGYSVYQGATLLTTVSGTSYNVTGLSGSTSYTFTVKAKDAANNLSSGVSVSITTPVAPDTTAPNNVTNLVTSNVAQTGLTLTWSASSSSDVASYDIYNGVTLLTNVTGTTYNVTGLTANTNYTFTVKAKDASNNVASGTSVTITTLVNPPSDVTNLTTANVTNTNLTLNWTASSGATSYDVYNGVTLLGNTTSTTYNVTGLTASTQYTFKVIAKNAGGSSTGVTTTVTTNSAADVTPPSDVSGLSTGTATINSIPVSWSLSPSNDVANYEVAYSSNGGSTWTVASALVNSSSTSYTITGLVAGTNYTIRVVAIDTSSNRSTGVTTTKSTAASVNYVLSATPSTGSYNATQNVVLSVNPTGATIYYTTNNTTPTTSSSVYSSPIPVSANTTIKFFAQDGSGNATSVQTATYTIDTVAPTVTIQPVAGTYNATQNVQITSNEGTIYYTTDGTTPTTGSTVYSTPISVSATQTIKYLVVDTAGNQTTGSVAYTIDTVAPDPVTNLAVGTVTSTTIPVTWTAPSATDVSKYEVAYSSDSGTTYNIATSNLTAPATSYTVTGLTASTSYIVRVVAIDGVGNRSTPTTVSTTTSATVTPLVSDGFTRANGALGNADTGQTWIYNNNAQNFSIANNGVTHTVSSVQDNCYVALTSGNYRVSVTLKTLDTQSGVVFKRNSTAATNEFYALRFGSSTSTLDLIKYTPTGGVVTLKTQSVTATSGVIMSVEVVGDTYTAYLNGNLVYSVSDTDAKLTANAGYGLYQSGLKTTVYDDFKVEVM